MSLINPCSVSSNPVNTGSECSDSIKATAMIIAMPKILTWGDSELLDFTSFLKTHIHATLGSRVYPIMGNSQPVRGITEGNENDVIESLDDGSVKFIRYGMYNKTIVTTEGGLSLARKLMGMSQNFGFVEIDNINQVVMYKKSTGVYAPFPVNLMYAPAPILANLKTSFKTQFMISFSPNYYVRRGIVFASDLNEDILSLQGLYDAQVVAGTANVQSTTHAFVKVSTIDAGTDLVALYAGTLAVAGNFIIKSAGGSPITPSAVTITNGEINFTGTFTTGTTITVELAAPSVLKAAGIEGYEGIIKASVPIP